MSTEKMREEFEAAYTEGLVARCGEGFRSTAEYSLEQRRQDGEYLNYPDFIAWWAWQASRAAIEVELREAYQKGWDASGEGWNAEYPGDAHIRESWQLEREKSLGLKVKP